MSVLVGRDKTKRDTYTISSLLEAVKLKQIRDDHKQQEIQISFPMTIEMVLYRLL